MTLVKHVLNGQRVTLSSPEESDIDRVTELCQDPEIQAWTTVPSPYSRDDARDFVSSVVPEGWLSGRCLTWGIRVKSGSELIGMVGLDSIENGEGEVGYWVGSSYRRHGYLREALTLVLDYAFAPSPSGIGLRRVVWHAIVGNAASASVARRHGFRFEGTIRLGGIQRGVRLDSWQAARLSGDPDTPAAGWPEETFVQLHR